MNITKEKDWENFTNWWLNSENFKKAEKIYGKQAEENAVKIELTIPKKELDCFENDFQPFKINLYSDELEKLAWKNELHLN